MLILNRRRGEAILLDGGIRIVVLECDKRGARIGIEAPAETNIQREELLLRVKKENERARATGEHKWVEALPLRNTSGKAAGPTAVSVAVVATPAGGTETDE